MAQWFNGSTVNSRIYYNTFSHLCLYAVKPFKFGTVFAFTQKTLYEKITLYYTHPILRFFH